MSVVEDKLFSIISIQLESIDSEHTMSESDEAYQQEFEEWLKNPPEEYRELFAEINEASAAYDRKSAQIKELIQEINSMADSMEASASELQEEANDIRQQLDLRTDDPNGYSEVRISNPYN